MMSIVDDRDFLLASMSRRDHTRQHVNRWNVLYAKHRAEFCDVRRRLFSAIHGGRDIGEFSSTDLCQIERYTACVNVMRGDEERHVCDILPIVLGTELDRTVRSAFWATATDRERQDDTLKFGLILQNKNFQHFTSCMVTNPKVAHIYRRNAKRTNMEVRLYFYDRNYRGNKVYLCQNLRVTRCNVATCPDECRMLVFVQERLMLRDCFKHDYLLLERSCPWHSSSPIVTRILSKRRTCASSPPTCVDVLPNNESEIVLSAAQVTRNICDCPTADVFDSGTIRYDNEDVARWLVENCMPDDPQHRCSHRQRILDLFLYLREVLLRNEDIDMLCNKCVYDGPILYEQFLTQFSSAVRDAVCVLSPSMDTLISRMRELSHTGNLYMLISRKTNIKVDQTNDMKRLIKTSLKREKSSSMDLGTVPKCFAVTPYTAAPTTPPPLPQSPLSSTPSSPTMKNSSSDFVLRPRVTRVKRGVTFDPTRLRAILLAPTASHHLLSSSTAPSYYTGSHPTIPRRTLIYTSVVSYNVRQLMNYGGSYLMQGLSPAHYTDPEFVMSEIKRPRIANQQNSSKCSLMPRRFVPFLSLWRIGSIECAGRSMSCTIRTRLTFFVRGLGQVCEEYVAWLRHLYETSDIEGYVALRRAHDPRRCYAHHVLDCRRCFLAVVVNEVPVPAFHVDRHYERHLFVASKLNWPWMQFYRKSQQVLSVTAQSGVFVTPMMVCRDDETQTTTMKNAWRWCTACDMYFPTDPAMASSVLHLPPDLYATYSLKERTFPHELSVDGSPGNTASCRRHLWLSPNEMAFARTFLPARSTPFFYELVCHGALSVARFFSHVDISKTIVSINALKRSLRFLGERWPSDDLRSPLESLVDQNSRVVVHGALPPWTTASSCASIVPHDETRVVSISRNNTFIATFMFGDYEGFNCEDAYVFDDASRPIVENVVQLKVNYYKRDRSVVRNRTVRFAFDPCVTLKPVCGCTVRLGRLLSYERLSFGSTMIDVSMSRCGSLYSYVFFHDTDASYLRRDQPVFSHGDSAQLRFDRPDVHATHFDDADDLVGIRTLYHATAATRNRNLIVEAELTTRQVKFRVSYRNVRTTQKVQNMCGQKGMPVYRDLSDLVTETHGPVHLIVSGYAFLGRRALSQTFEQMSNAGCAARFGPLLRVYSRSTGRHVGYGGRGVFFFSCDSAHENSKTSGPNNATNPMRVCKLTYSAAIDNGLSTAIFNRNADHESYKNNPANGVPYNISRLFGVYRLLNRSVEFDELSTRRVRQQARDWSRLRAMGLRPRVPDSLRLLEQQDDSGPNNDTDEYSDGDLDKLDHHDESCERQVRERDGDNAQHGVGHDDSDT